MMRKKRLITIILAIIMIVSLVLSFTVTTFAFTSIEERQYKLNQEKSSIYAKLETLQAQITECADKIESQEYRLAEIESQYQTLAAQEEQQYTLMKGRIKYMYEGGYNSLLAVVFSASNLSDLLNKAEYVESISRYDREQILKLQAIKDEIKANRDALLQEQQEIIALKDSLNNDIASLRSELASINADLFALDEEAAAAAAAQVSQAIGGDSSQGGPSVIDIIAPNRGYTYAAPGSGILNPFDGVVYFNGHKETYYSQKVLPGGGLNIPGRYVAGDGTVRDGSGFICLASSDYPKGTVVQTTLGPGKVYDCGCPSGVIDVYTDW